MKPVSHKKKFAVREHPQTATFLTFAKSVFCNQLINVSSLIRLQLQPWEVLNIESKTKYLLCDIAVHTSTLSFLFLFFFHSQSIFYR